MWEHGYCLEIRAPGFKYSALAGNRAMDPYAYSTRSGIRSVLVEAFIVWYKKFLLSFLKTEYRGFCDYVFEIMIIGFWTFFTCHHVMDVPRDN